MLDNPGGVGGGCWVILYRFDLSEERPSTVRRTKGAKEKEEEKVLWYVNVFFCLPVPCLVPRPLLLLLLPLAGRC